MTLVSAILPVMGNNLKALRNARSWTHDQAAEAMGVSRGQYIKLERGERRLTSDYISLAAKAFDVRASEVIDDPRPETVPLMGYIGAGAEIEPDFEQTPPEGLEQIDVPFPLPDDMIAFEVRGDSMLPVFKNRSIIIVYREQKRPIDAFYGEEAAVRTSDGRRFIKTIMRSSQGVNLMSWNAPAIENVELDWVGEIFAVLPRASLKKVEGLGGIQGRLKVGG
ncbi:MULTISPECIES: XRE family transcriptional regulator [unclassified Rhizobium]|uniref:XRE family transcriptional regulator n=1 Tax=unclassified Rhizobium TaxID=2613769 RepID=UPI001ADCBCC3|nr:MULTISPECIES: XRE family transcriptional regulator [unclassified Rhizobium]MBO9099979.1 helix-turn-helix domain-containing protein [Rhizobium sp. L58/93]QXZ82790.1 helix-turn-helix domain-containing protein [Rhizobium sp. K1/93]QXZ89697.1 helix-turn-helix domain-containing protein [Rhizobium sp. K15/93]